MKRQARYYLFPRDAYFVPSAGRLVGLVDVMDRELQLGLQDAGTFRAFVRGRVPEEQVGEGTSDPILDTASFDDFRSQGAELPGEPKELQVHLGRPRLEPLRDCGDLETKGVEVLGFPSLRMIDVGELAPTFLLCPSCGERSTFDTAFSVRPDPRFYCGRCGGLTPLPDTRFAQGEGGTELPFPCYRFVIVFHAESDADLADPVSAPTAAVLGVQAIEGALGCGLRAVLVGSPRRTPA